MTAKPPLPKIKQGHANLEGTPLQLDLNPICYREANFWQNHVTRCKKCHLLFVETGVHDNKCPGCGTEELFFIWTEEPL